MAEPLKNHFGRDVPKRIAASLKRVEPRFDDAGFVRRALRGYDDLELMPRGRAIADAMAEFLPAEFKRASAILIASLGPKLEGTEGHGMAPFFYLPHVYFVANRGLDHFDDAMRAHYELTQRFTAEFGIRPFIEKHTDRCLALFAKWTSDPSVHVRRLVSEGTRPRLPWAARLRCFEKDPTPALALLERLKDDPEEYVRRSVANHLNDIGKDRPDLLVELCERWRRGADANRERLVRHALRGLVKSAHPGALSLLGYGETTRLRVDDVSITPRRPRIGESVTIALSLVNRGARSERALVDLRVHFVKANGSTSPKVFKLAELDLPRGARADLTKTISLAEMTTRKHFPGAHRVEAQVNGAIEEIGRFDLRRSLVTLC